MMIGDRLQITSPDGLKVEFDGWPHNIAGEKLPLGSQVDFIGDFAIQANDGPEGKGGYIRPFPLNVKFQEQEGILGVVIPRGSRFFPLSKLRHVKEIKVVSLP